MDEIAIAAVTRADIPLLDSALRRLAADLDDSYRAGPDLLTQALCDPGAAFLALLARRGDRPMGATLAAPVFSTIYGGAGLFVSDLWVAPEVRGKGLARRLLAATLREGRRRKTGHYLKLTVYDDNPGARAVYDRLGFAAQSGDTNMILTGAALDRLGETR
ncbi:GNAT family N-acetyltransferase [Frigidibacter sp. ROC022]|uniref:GNAT family N-acetyltransferase n=1 Tax=Frigidibacter sp. ROC022 TaxID=2971796 RepID=UPI00215B2C76|nr:GNAT family N-acetyltransferase [Frigidibacter sp. ROC022]MCR8725519.1 GNAT family N-acetyltransferase [Frigidibacter sp. ROC022]